MVVVLLVGTAAAAQDATNAAPAPAASPVQDQVTATQVPDAPAPAALPTVAATPPPVSMATPDATATQAPSATATAVVVTGPAKQETSRNWYALYDGDHFGLEIDAGAPAGAAAAFVFRPWYFVRLNAGVATDVIGVGVKGGVTLVPFHWGVVPTLGFEAGHFWQGDATRFGTVSDAALNKLLQSVGYDYLSADVGLEFGSQDRFVFYVRAGMTQVYPSTSNFQAALNAVNGLSCAAPPCIRAADPTLSGRSPAARLGFILYLF